MVLKFDITFSVHFSYEGIQTLKVNRKLKEQALFIWNKKHY